MDSLNATVLTGGLNIITNIISGWSFYWMTSETLVDLAHKMFQWITLTDKPPSFWALLASDLATAKDYINILCKMKN